MESLEDLPNRLRRLIELLELPSPNAFATAVGLPQQSISNLLMGKVKPSAASLSQIATRYPHLSLTWLLTGAGQAFPAGVHGERAAAPVPAPDTAEALSQAVVAQAEAQMYAQQVQSQNQLIAALRAEVERLRKSGGSPDQPRPSSPTTPPRIGFHVGQRAAGVLALAA